MIKPIKKSQGFGIIEVLLASVIIIVVVFSLSAVASSSLTATDRSADRTQAVNLAQEGIETVRQIRDSHWIDQDSTSDWGKWVNTGSGWNLVNASTEYSVSYVSALGRYSLVPASLASKEIKLDNSIFNRVIKISDVKANAASGSNGLIRGKDVNESKLMQDKAYKVTVDVTTPSGAVVTVSEVLTDWRPNY